MCIPMPVPLEYNVKEKNIPQYNPFNNKGIWCMFISFYWLQIENKLPTDDLLWSPPLDMLYD